MNPPPSFRKCVADARPPREYLLALPEDARPCLLEPLAPNGWGSAPGGGASGPAVLALDPEVAFAGGFEALLEARRWLDGQRSSDPSAARLIGCLAYELGAELYEGRVPAPREPLPPAVELAGFRAAYYWDGATRRGEVRGGCARAVALLEEQLAALPRVAACSGEVALDARPRSSDAEFLKSVLAIQEYVRAGDVYQVNLSRRLDAAAPGSVELRALYAQLAARAPAAFSAHLETGTRTLLSASPERFLRVAGARVETRPIKGTRPRAADPAEDSRLARELLASAKDRAEHVMIVDLERNDLGRACAIGSVRVPSLAALESTTDVHHLVSSVEGALRDPADWPGLIAATFPGGSISGAPKLRAMQIVAGLEPVPRDVYTGAIGCFDAAGGVDLSLAIRTAVARGGELHLHLGGGIVADSEPELELAETRAKGRGFARSWGLDG